MTDQTKLKTTERQRKQVAAYRKQMQDEGFTQIRVWVPNEGAAWMTMAATRMREWKDHGVAVHLPPMPEPLTKAK